MDGERGLSSISSGVWTLLLLVRVPLLVVLVFALMVLDYLVQDATFEAIRFVVLDRPEQLGMIGALLFAACFALRFTAEAMILLVAPHLIKSRVGWVAWALPRLIALAPAAILGARFFVVGQDGDSFLASGDPALFDPAAAQALTSGAGLYFALIGVAVAALPKTAKAAGEEEGLGFARLGALTPASGITLLVLLGAAVAVFFMFWDWSNVAPAQFVGPVGVVLLWAFAASMYFFPVAFASHATRLPLLLLLLGAAIAFSEYNLNDNHQIRTVTLRRPEKIPYFNQDLSLVDWLRAREDLDLYDYEHYPIFVVAAEGGAMRSAYFTARVLKTLQDVCPAFAHHTIGISAVSGGSVGAASFIALNTLRRAPMKGDAPCDFTAIPEHRVAQDSLDVLYSKDLLSPLLGATLFPDALQRLLPVAIPEFDRARAIECAFESGLNDATASAFNKEPCKDRYLPLNRIYGGVHRWYETQRALGEKRRVSAMRAVDRVDRKTALNTPHLFLNTTDVTLGVPVPIVTGRVPYRLVRPRSDGATTSGSVQGSFQPMSTEGGGTVDLPLSVAAFLSARFPFVMPAGWHQPYYRFIDGGLFEDSGSWFAEQTVRYLEGQIEEVRAAPEAYDSKFRRALLNASITVIVLRATPCESDFGKVTQSKTLPPHLSGDVECVQQTLQTADEGSNEIGSPVRALLRTRLGRGYDALESLRAYAKDQGRAFFERLAACTDARDVCLKKIEALQESQSLPVPIQVREVRFRNDPHVHIPLTWTLSRQAKAHLDEAIETPLDQYREGGAAVASRFGVGIAPPNYNAVVCALAVRQRALFESAPAACKTAGALPDWQRPLDQANTPTPDEPSPPPVQPPQPTSPPPVSQPTPPKPKDAKPPLPEIDRCEGCPPKTP